MLFVQVCVGSSCHLKGSQDIVELFEKAIEEHHIEDEVVLSGSFCIGKCNRVGVTVQVNDDIHVGVTRENFREFFKKNISSIAFLSKTDFNGLFPCLNSMITITHIPITPKYQSGMMLKEFQFSLK